jgi:uncharacterized protein (DUF58 family)
MKLPAWIHRRLRRKPQVYLMPTVEGWWWIGTLFILLLMGWGYTNNLCLALGMLLVAVTVVLLMEAHFNLDGIRLKSLLVEDQYQDSPAAWHLWWQAKRPRERRALLLSWDDTQGPEGEFQLPAAKEGDARGPWIFHKRGHWKNSHVKLSSRYPLGLFKAWSYHAVTVEAWVYPKPFSGPVPHRWWDEGLGSSVNVESHSGDEPGDFRRYQEGDAPTRVAWKAIARGLPPHSKTFTEELSQRAFYHWPYGPVTELALGQLAHWIERHYLQQESWALQVDGVIFKPDSGSVHRKLSLRALAGIQL